MSIQYNIDKLIEAKGLTKTGVAKVLGISRDTVYNLNESTKIGTFIKLCKMLNCELSDIIDEKNDKDHVREPIETYKTNKISDIERELLEALKELNECRKENYLLNKQLAKKQK